MAINLEREGIYLNAEERNKRNRNLDKIEQAISEVGNAVPEAQAAKKLAEESKIQSVAAEEKAENVQTQINELVVQGDSSVEAAQARVSVDGTAYATLKERLDVERQDTTVKLAETGERIDNVIATAGDGTTPTELVDMRVLGNQTFSTAGQALRAIANGSALADKAIAPEMLSFVQKPNNILHFANAKRGFAYSGGQLVESQYYTATEKTPIKPNRRYSSLDVYRTTFFNLAGSYIGATEAANYTTPSEAFFATYTLATSKILTVQVSEGETLLQKDSAEYKIGNDKSRVLIQPTPKSVKAGSFVKDAVHPADAAYFRNPKNLFNKNTVTSGMNIDTQTGEPYAEVNAVLSAFIPVTPGSTISKSPVSARIVMSTRQKDFIRGSNPSGSVQSIVLPESCEYIQVSIAASALDEFMLNEGTELLPFEEHVFVLESTPELPVALSDKTDRIRDFLVVDPALNNVFSSQLVESKALDSTEPLANMTLAEIYALYDELMAAHPEYISRKLLGNDAFGNAIYKYDFKPLLPAPTDGGSVSATKRIKYIVTSGTHGVERASIWITYLAMKSIVEGWKTNELLESLRWNIHFVVVPIVSPTSFIDKTRKNRNGVDINRNQPAEWRVSDPSIETYGGTAPLSELESQYIYQLMKDNRDAVYHCDFHNFFSDPSGQKNFLWIAAASRFDGTMGRFLINQMSRKWEKEHAFLGQSGRHYGYVTFDAGKGSIAVQALKFGISSCSFEIDQQFRLEENGSAYSALTLTLGLEAFVNWLAVSIRNVRE